MPCCGSPCKRGRLGLGQLVSAIGRAGARVRDTRDVEPARRGAAAGGDFVDVMFDDCYAHPLRCRFLISGSVRPPLPPSPPLLCESAEPTCSGARFARFLVLPRWSLCNQTVTGIKTRHGPRYHSARRAAVPISGARRTDMFGFGPAGNPSYPAGTDRLCRASKSLAQGGSQGSQVARALLRVADTAASFGLAAGTNLGQDDLDRTKKRQNRNLEGIGRQAGKCFCA